ncbi:hypothetical protein L6452_17661 [Arctium lappa]|uniref:Uncharacterized protein n=1 Tax=Arctium lappa TaxID=4217 RepID=A0ACB9C484_ARCLA|nr:hypothetical protein L6452_17661 [Arctium lappa]
MMHPNRVRRPSQRILMKTAFSRFKNTPDNNVLLDEDDGNSVPPGNGNVEEVEVDNQAMLMEMSVNSITETEGERNGKEDELENRAIPMNVVVDSSTETEGVESLMADLKMNDSECIDNDTSGPKPMKERKETVDFIRGGPSSTKNTKDDCFQVGNSSRVTRSQRRKQLEEERARKEYELQPPNMGAHNAAPKRASESGYVEYHYGQDGINQKAKTGSRSLFQSSSASGEKTSNTTKKTGLVNECTDIVLIQQVDDPLAKLWDSPTYVEQVYESMCVSVENSKAMKFIKDKEPPGFDLGINPGKDVQQEHASVAGASSSWGQKIKERESCLLRTKHRMKL